MVVSWANNVLSSVTLDAAGILAIAELPTLRTRTVLKGTAFWADVFVLCPGIHRQQDATTLNGGEYPVTANMSSGYVFRVENQATVHFLQSIGTTGSLTTLSVKEDKSKLGFLRPFLDLSGSPLSALLYLTPAMLTCGALALMAIMHDFWGLFILLVLMLARFLNILVIRQRCDANWHGAREPGVTGDLLVLLSQDRWIRIQGLTDHLKAVTSGQWLRDTTFIESILEGFGTILVYLSAALAGNASQVGKIMFLVLLLLSAGILSLSNECLGTFQMKNHIIRVEGSPKKYVRRLAMAEQLIKESGRRDWALRMGMVNAQDDQSSQNKENDQEGNPENKEPDVDLREGVLV